jgi:phenylpropionate dioxygenase-like ring-hydroxylating dioxygenase large terminal subunit
VHPIFCKLEASPGPDGRLHLVEQICPHSRPHLADGRKDSPL